MNFGRDIRFLESIVTFTDLVHRQRLERCERCRRPAAYVRSRCTLDSPAASELRHLWKCPQDGSEWEWAERVERRG